jgi:mRNA interferase MazF
LLRAVVLVRLPRDKARPAVVVGSGLLSELSYATVLPITTELRAGFSVRIDLAPTPENGLRLASQVDWPQTVRFSDMGESIGRLDIASMRAVTRQLAVALGIGSSTKPRCSAGRPVFPHLRYPDGGVRCPAATRHLQATRRQCNQPQWSPPNTR